MNPIETNLFVGGPIDGKRMPVESGAYYVEVPVHEPIHLTWEPDVVLAPPDFRRERYVAEYLLLGEASFKFWRYTQISRFDAIQQLFVNYRTEDKVQTCKTKAKQS